MERPTQKFFAQAALVTLGCLTGAIYCGFLLYQDVHNLGTRTGSPIAKLERLEARVRLKAAQSFVWGPAHVAQDLYTKDSVQTPPNGGAAVKFNDGSVLEVGENSLIVIDQLENLSLGFIKGSAILRTTAGDSRISLDETGKTKVEKLPVRLIKPAAFSELLSEKSSRMVDFSWTLAASDGKTVPSMVELQVSPDRKFTSKNLKTVSLPNSQNEASLSLPSGRFYWRVVGADLKAEPSQFRVDTVAALKPIYPVGGQTIEAFGDSTPIEFNWEPEEEDSALSRFSHKIEISKFQDFSQIITSIPVTATSGTARTKGITSGEFYWRLASLYKDPNQSLELRSASQKFQINRIERVAINQTSPEDSAELKLNPNVGFGWNSETSGLNYIFEIREKNSQSIRSQLPLKTSQNVTLARIEPQLPVGTYEWRVKASLSVGATTSVGESPWRNVRFYDGDKPVLKTPLAQQEFKYWSEVPKFHLTWSVDSRVQSGERSFIVEIANHADFSGATRVEVGQPDLASDKVKWTEGEQFWRVSVVDAKKQVVTTSDVSHFFFGTFPPLRAPASVSPPAGTVYNPLVQDKPLVVKWEEFKDAQGYELTVKSGEQVIFRKNTLKAEFEFKGVKPGKYHFTVSAIDPLKRKGESTADRDFEVTYGDTLDAPESVSPEVQ